MYAVPLPNQDGPKPWPPLSPQTLPDKESQATVLLYQGIRLLRQNHLAEAETSLRQSLEIGRRVFSPDNPKLAWALSNLGQLWESQARYTEAEAAIKEAIVILERSASTD